jgi:ATP dependent DNA ligase-like protein
MTRITPMRLLRIPQPFDHPAFLYEPKMDGFRALAHIRGHHCTLVSRNGHVFKSWPQLAEEIAHAVRAHSAVLDGEICCLEGRVGSTWRMLEGVCQAGGHTLRASRFGLLMKMRRREACCERHEVGCSGASIAGAVREELGVAAVRDGESMAYRGI